MDVDVLKVEVEEVGDFQEGSKDKGEEDYWIDDLEEEMIF